jgi:hypothetical protein
MSCQQNIKEGDRIIFLSLTCEFYVGIDTVETSIKGFSWVNVVGAASEAGASRLVGCYDTPTVIHINLEMLREGYFPTFCYFDGYQGFCVASKTD